MLNQQYNIVIYYFIVLQGILTQIDSQFYILGNNYFLTIIGGTGKCKVVII